MTPPWILAFVGSKMKPTILQLIVILIATGATVQAQKTSLANRFVAFKFDSNNGTYEIIDCRDNTVCIENATFGIDKYLSDRAANYQLESRKISDELGVGEQIVISGTAKDQPWLRLILEVSVYDDRGYIVLNQGVENQSDHDYRVMEFSPLRANAFEVLTMSTIKHWTAKMEPF